MILKYLFILLLLTGCMTNLRTPASISIFDFGPITQSEFEQPVAPAMQIEVAEITAPQWLDAPAMLYRLAYHHPAQTHAFANHRWAASPASLLTERIRQRVMSWQNPPGRSKGGPRPAIYLLKIELEEFMQVFDDINDSHVVISLRVSLVERNTRELVSRQRFVETEATASADASGGVKAFITASDRLTAELIAWLAKVVDHSTRLPESRAYPEVTKMTQTRFIVYG